MLSSESSCILLAPLLSWHKGASCYLMICIVILLQCLRNMVPLNIKGVWVFSVYINVLLKIAKPQLMSHSLSNELCRVCVQVETGRYRGGPIIIYL